MKAIIILWLATTLAGGAAPRVRPANPNTNPQAVKVLEFFHSLESRQEKRILSGQFIDFGHRANSPLMQQVFDKTGHWPAILGVDYADFRTGGLTFQEPNRAVIDYWNQGGIVTVGVHLYNPANPKGGGLRDKGVDMASLLDPDTETHSRWMKQLDQLAAGLQELKDAGVVVLWRPFHEMNGGWFWWGAQNPETFIKVWRHMFDYFADTKKLDHLLWVYGPNHGQNTAKYYAGDNYVDLVGLDAYTDHIDKEHIRGYDEVAALPKPFGFTEFGPHGSQNPPGNYDYLRFIQGIEKNFPRTTFFMSWNARWSLASNTNTKELLNHPLIANREDLPPGLAGKGK